MIRYPETVKIILHILVSYISIHESINENNGLKMSLMAKSSGENI